MALSASPICGTSERWEVVSATQITRSVAPNDGGPEDGSPIITAVRRAIIYRASRGLAPRHRATRERLSACLFIGRPRCEGAGADPAHDASKVGEIAVVKRVAEHVLQEVVVALAGLPGH
jgi:hypothetical protein